MKRNQEIQQYADFVFSDSFQTELKTYRELTNRALDNLAEVIYREQKAFQTWRARLKNYLESHKCRKTLVWAGLSHLSRHSLAKNGSLYCRLAKKIIRNTQCPDVIGDRIMDLVYIARPYIDLMGPDVYASIGKLMIVIFDFECLNEIEPDELMDDIEEKTVIHFD